MSLRLKELNPMQDTAASHSVDERFGTEFQSDLAERHGAWKNYVVASALVLLGTGAPLTVGMPIDRQSLPLKEIKKEGALSMTFGDILDRVERVVFSHPAVVSEIHNSPSGHPRSASLLVSVDGKDKLLNCPFQHFKFEIKPNMRVIVEGVFRGGTKQLSFRKVEGLRLDNEQEDALGALVSSFERL